MKKIIITLIISGLTGCKTLPQKPELTALSQLSTDELCQSLGTFNDDGKFILKIHDELSKRTEEMNTERCFSLEMGAKNELNKSNEFNKKNRSMMNQDFLYPLPTGLSKHELDKLRKEQINKNRRIRKIHK